MIEKGRISALQMATLLYPTIIATAILLVPAITGEYAKKDMWLSPIWASLAGLFVIFLAVKLEQRFPEQTIIQYSGTITGKLIGKLIGVLIVLYYFHATGIILLEYGNFVIGSFLPRTPLLIVIGSMVLVCGLAVRGGIEVMARTAQVLVPFVILFFTLIMILLTPELNLDNLFPVMEYGLKPSLKGAIIPASWFLQLFIIAFILPVLKKGEKIGKAGILTVITVMITLVITNLVTLLLFGVITTSFTYPVMEAARFISVADFLQHLESVVMAIWVAGTFIKVSLFYYVVVIGTAQVLHISDFRPIVLPIGLFLTVLSFWTSSSLQELEQILITSFPFYDFFVLIIIPMLLLVIAKVRKKGATKNRRNKGKVKK
ncbi:GerAB/ArcD/ProY family transporter [Ornithinibacillus bavariensis]|uniref:Germination protein n=1 Tax=Ornithinibacillus bavariensis TaxID=545502 RepID=A0A919X7X3_9BACI|nr:endospore germination permease [Ornithinibacillus bavariensis]GIO25758.1 germination protein [Ornithinibacillus bavariensis]